MSIKEIPNCSSFGNESYGDIGCNNCYAVYTERFKACLQHRNQESIVDSKVVNKNIIKDIEELVKIYSKGDEKVQFELYIQIGETYKWYKRKIEM